MQEKLDYLEWSAIKDDDGKLLEAEMETAIKTAAQLGLMFKPGDPKDLDIQKELNGMAARVFKSLDRSTSLIIAGLTIELRRLRDRVAKLENDLAAQKAN